MRKNRAVRRPTLAALSAAFFVLAAAGLIYTVGSAGSVDPVVAGRAVVRPLAPGDVHTYRIQAADRDFLHVVVDQRRIDLAVGLLDPQGRRLIRADRPIGSGGREEVMAVAQGPGDYRIEIRVEDGPDPGGSYELKVEALRPATDRDRGRAQAARLFFHGEELRRGGDPAAAVTEYQAALALWQEVEAPLQVGETHYRLGHSYDLMDRWTEAAEHYGQAVDRFHTSGNRRWEAAALSVLGRGYFAGGEVDKAMACHRRALPLWQALGESFGEAMSGHNLAQGYQVKGEIGKALELYDRVLHLWTHDRDRANTVHNLGVLYRLVGKSETALEHLTEAGRIYRQMDHPAQAASLNQLGRLHHELGELDKALDFHHRALKLRRKRGHLRGQAAALSEIGRLLHTRGQLGQAQQHYDEALALHRELDRPRSKAKVLLYLASLHDDLGRPQAAVDAYGQALAIYRQVGDPTGEAEGLFGLAQAEGRRGNLEAALDASARGLDIVESVRATSLRPSVRTSYFATVQPHFERHIDLLMQADQGERALRTSERARARSLLDLLAEAKADIRGGVDSQLVDEERDLQRKINSYAEKRFQLGRLLEAGAVGQQTFSRQVAALEQALGGLLAQLEQVRERIRVHSPRYAALTQPQPLPLVEIQSLLDEQTVLLEYELGEERSFLWVVTPKSLKSFELPGRDRIEEAARPAHRLLSHSYRFLTRQSLRRALCRLSRQVLAPALDELGGKRLVIVADGVLEYIPFAALPHPRHLDSCSSAPPLVTQYEITHLPSASALAVLRRERQRRSLPQGRVAVVADPVFTRDDERLPTFATGRPGPQEPDPASPWPEGAGQGSRPVGYPEAAAPLRRLPYSHQEADSILAGVPPGETSFEARGFEANKKTVMGQLDRYRILHFATHGWLNSKHPELSGLVLSRFDRQGRELDGFLRLHEIYNLKLRADLVVLSACETALGSQVRGEGLVGLTRGFMYAGASRVMVSLWRVGDRGTAELMARFYGGLLEKGLQPQAALRQAQLSMLAEESWAAPYHWAGFVIQGEWE